MGLRGITQVTAPVFFLNLGELTIYLGKWTKNGGTSGENSIFSHYLGEASVMRENTVFTLGAHHFWTHFPR